LTAHADAREAERAIRRSAMLAPPLFFAMFFEMPPWLPDAAVFAEVFARCLLSGEPPCYAAAAPLSAMLFT